MDANETAARIRARRAYLGLTQAEVSEAAGVSQSLLARVEGGKRPPTVEAVVRIAGALRITPQRLMFGCVTDLDQAWDREDD